ncbi:hypothetical protein RB653_009471 [Dictyostelium firmibasis]|uniref:Carrier domain-containing protein n=1 Tax=Dictyostelium firmibasis TaxID=79012 RepID=A0AAN7YQ69_9MYCE
MNKIENDDRIVDDVAVIGIGLRFPSGDLKKSISKPNQLFDSLLNGFDGIVTTSERWSDNYYLNGDVISKYAGLLPLDEWKQFDPIFFAINPTYDNVSSIDPQQRILLKCVWEALEDSGIDPISLRGTNTSTFIGSSTIDYCTLQKSPFETQNNIFGSSTHSVANRIGYCFDFRGENLTIDTACSSSLNAINCGYNSIKSNKSNLSIVGGVNFILDPHISKSFTQLGLLSPTGRCHTFSSDADGYVRSEGVGIVVLKRLKDAIKDSNNIYCVIKGSSSNVDGNYDKLNFYSPSKSSQCENIKLAIKSTNGQINESDIDYCETHGTGTPTGDPIELEGISKVFNYAEKTATTTTNKQILVGSIKSNIGHTEACSGVASLIKCCLMFKNKLFLQNIHFKEPNPSIKFEEWGLKVVTEPIKFNENKKTVMLINNFGVTGSNVCLVLSEFKNHTHCNNDQMEIDIKLNEKKKYLIPLSSNSLVSLDNYKSLLIKDLKSSTSFQQFVHNQILFKSTSLIQKSVIIASDWNEFQDENNQIKLSNSGSLISNITVEKKKPPITVIVLCGQGSQYNKMALSLYDNEPIFRDSVNRFDKELSKYYGYSVLEKLRSVNEKDQITIHEPILAQPANVMIQVSLYELYKHWGVSADIIIGHSLGEVSSPYCSGMIDFKTLCYLVYHRSVAQNRTTGTGRMLSVNISPEEFVKKYQSTTKYQSLEIACYNSPTSIVIAGKEDILNEITREFKSNETFCAMLGSLSSFHTSSQFVIKDEVCSLNIKSKQPSIPVFSTVTTNLFNQQTSPFTAEYVFDNIYQPVYFTQTMTNLYKYIESNDMGNEITFIEVAPHPTLQYYLAQMKSIQSSYFDGGKNITIYSPLHKKKNDYNEFLKTISLLYVKNNFNIDFKSQLTDINNENKNNLPLYQWDDKEYFRQNSLLEKIKNEGPAIHTLGNSTDSSCPSYQTFIDIKKPSFQWLKGHQVNDKVYYPGMGYVQNLLSLYPDQDITITSLEFKSPLVLTEGSNQCLQTIISPLSKNEFNVKSHYKDQKTNQWILSSLGNFSLFKHNIFDEANKLIDIQALKDKCNFTTIPKQDIYETIRIKASLTYKGLFQGVKQAYIGNNCSLAIVSLNEITNQKEHNHLTHISGMDSFFNAAILDSCLHGLLGFITQPVVLDRVEGFKLYSSNIPSSPSSLNNNGGSGDDIKELYVYSEMKTRTNSQSYSGSIKIILPNGRLLVEISNVVCTSISLGFSDSTIICKPPSDCIYTPHLQSKDSNINKPEQFKHLYNIDEFSVKEEDNQFISIELLLSLFYKHINIRCPNINLESLPTLEYNQFKHLYYNNSSVNENLFKFIFENLKRYCNIHNQSDNSYCSINVNGKSEKNKELFTRTTKIMAKQLFPLKDDDTITDTPQSLFENGFLDDFYKNSRVVQPLNNLLSEIIVETLKPILNQPIVFRILEAGGGTGSLSLLILEKIYTLLNNNPSIIDIEFTWSDISASFFTGIKEKFSSFTNLKNLRIIYCVLDIEKPLLDQDIKPCYYDLVVMSNVMHVVKKLEPTLNQIHNILTPNGQLVYIEPPYKSIYYDSIFGCFSQWWPSSDGDVELRTDRCCMKQEKWVKLLNQCNYKDTTMSGNNSLVFLIQTRKPTINETISESSLDQFNSFDNIILFSDNNIGDRSNIQSLISSNQELMSKIININNFNDFQSWITSNNIGSRDGNNKTLIIFLKSIESSINISNFKAITYEYIQINQLILKLELSNNFKHLLLSLNSTSDNYLSSSIVGAARYFVEFPQLDLYILNFDSISIKCNQLLQLINYLINPNNNIQREFTINNNNIYYERYSRQSNIKSRLQSKSFETDKDNLYMQLNSNLEYQLYCKKSELSANEVEIEVKATGINYKDYLMYIGMISSDLDLKYGKEYEVENGIGIENPKIGNDFSGVITRLGCDIKKFKVGDQVFGVGTKTSGSHFIIDHNFIYHKPSNYDHTVSASIPSIYVTSLHSIYSVGNLKTNESILIHSATGGVGLSSLDLLKSKQHKGYIFLTVGSKEKEEYLRENYGSFITGIYSSRNKDYVDQIKNKLIELDVVEQGVDLIINTLSSEYMDSNFQCLNQYGRIVDLSITHLTPNNYMTNNHFKFNMGYSNVELVEFTGKLVRSYLKKIVKMINSNKLEIKVPIIEYLNNQFKDAIEYINERKHIGKIVVNHSQDEFDRVYSNYQSCDEQIVMKHSYDVSKLNIGKNILLTGQTGIILEILKYLVRYSNKSIENIIILSKSKLKWELELLINQTRFKKNNLIKFHFIQIDIEDSVRVNQVLNELELKESITNIDSIIHFAFMNDIGDVQQVDMNRLNNAHGAKTIGAINLHNESINRSWNIKQFIMASSVVSIFGSDQQCCYVSSCSVIDSLSKYRHSLGLPSLAINLGAISSTGFVSRNNAIKTMFKSSILKLFSPQLVISSLDLFVQNQNQYPNYCISDFNFEVLPSNIKNYHLFKLDYQINMKKSNQYKVGSSDSDDNSETVRSTILNKISELLSIEVSKINEDLQLTQYGMDSLVIVQLKNFIDNQLGHNLITIQQLQNNKINQSIEIIKSGQNNNANNNNNNNNNNNSNFVKKHHQKESLDEFIYNEIKLDDSIVSKPHSIRDILNSNNKSIFLTGSTGFLGAYLLIELIKMNNISKIYCLIRNNSKLANPIDEIINNLKKHHLIDMNQEQKRSNKILRRTGNISKDKLHTTNNNNYKDNYNQVSEDQLIKVIPLVGDISKHKFGLNQQDYLKISDECDIIINTAANLNLKTKYQENKVVNVNSVNEVIKLSVSNNNNQKLIVHFSSIAVFINHQLTDSEEFEESKILPNFDSTSIGYIQSKVISEKLLTNAAESRGIPSIIIRPPDIFSNPITGKGHSNDFVSLSLKCSKEIGYYPNIHRPIFTAPVTTIAQNTINIIFNENSWNQNKSKPISIYSLNGNSIEMKSIYEILEKNFKCKETNYEEWVEKIAKSNGKSSKRYSAFHIHNNQHSMTTQSNINTKFKMSNSTKELLMSIGSYNDQDWEINESIILNNINNNE